MRSPTLPTIAFEVVIGAAADVTTLAASQPQHSPALSPNDNPAKSDSLERISNLAEAAAFDLVAPNYDATVLGGTRGVGCYPVADACRLRDPANRQSRFLPSGSMSLSSAPRSNYGI
jgi:hypothetical protein